MEPLFKRSDGAVETPSGLFAVKPVAKSGTTPDGVAWFEFRSHMLADIVRIEWQDGASLIIIEADTAKMLVANNYAAEVDDGVLEQYAAAYDKWLEANPSPSPSHPRKPVVKPAPALPPVAPQTPAPTGPTAEELAAAEAVARLAEEARLAAEAEDNAKAEAAAIAKIEQDEKDNAEALAKAASDAAALAPPVAIKPDWATPKKPKG